MKCCSSTESVAVVCEPKNYTEIVKYTKNQKILGPEMGQRAGPAMCYLSDSLNAFFFFFLLRAGRLASGARTRAAFMYAVDVVREHGRG